VATDSESFREYVSGQLPKLRRTAYLLCGDWHTADDLVSTALIRLLRHWRRVSTMDNVDAYARRVLLRTWLNELRRPWRREITTQVLPDRPAAGDGPAEVTDRLSVLALLATLPPRRRAVLVLRYCCDLSVEETAEALGCGTGTVKSQSARALDTLRARLGAKPVYEEK
jgi:RNA polymerase sigma-70 factor (sigma-E family)